MSLFYYEEMKYTIKNLLDILHYLPEYSIIVKGDKMIIKYDTERLARIANDIYDLTGISISVLDTEMRCLANSSPNENYCKLLQSIKGEQPRCEECDRQILELCRKSGKLERHICREGLYDSAMPIVKQGAMVGFVIMGQVRSEGSPDAPRRNISEELYRAYRETPFLSEKQLSGLYDLLPCILFDSAIDTVHDAFISEAVEYVDSHLGDAITVSSICEKFHMSKNRLYESFRTYLGCTVTEYINQQRIIRAKRLLKESEKTIIEISADVGVNNYTYFCKLFKKTVGTTPTQYRSGQ